MTTTTILKSLFVVALLNCALAGAVEAIPVPEDSKTTGSFQVSEVRCQLVEGQIRCTFG